MIKVGQRVQFNPFKDIRQNGFGNTSDIVEGIVHFVHPTHGWFNIEYDGGAGMQLLGFRFDDIDKAVKIIN